MQILKCLFVSLVLAGCTRASVITPSARQGEGTIAFVGVTVVPMDRDGVLPNQNVITRGGRIVALGPASQLRVPAGARVIDGAGRFVIPGLWDMHVHLMTSPESTITLSDRAAHVYFPQLLSSGVTGVRDMGAPLDSIVALRDRVRVGEILGPRLIIAGALLAGRNPWGPPSEHSWTVRGSQEARAFVDSLRRAGADFIKVHDMLSDSALFAIAEHAREAGMKLVGHMRPQLTVQQVVDSGQIGLEHLPIELISECSGGGTEAAGRFYATWARGGWIPFINETIGMWKARDPARCTAILEYLRSRNVAVTPTVVLRMQDSVLMARASIEKFTPAAAASCRQNAADRGTVPDSLWSRYRTTALEVVGALHRAGVAVLAGSDGPGGCLAPGTALHEELLNLTEAGMTPFEALRSATVLPARFMGLADSVGAVAVGKVADLVLLNADPMTDIRNARSIEGVMVRGRWLSRAALDSMQSSSQSAAAPAVTLATETEPVVTTGPVIEVKDGQWYTGTGFTSRTFYIVHGILRDKRPSRIDSTIDLHGRFVIPPFGDAHTHNLDGAFNLDKVRDAYIGEGTFYVAVLTNTATGAEQVRSRFNRACDLDVVYANGGLTSTLSHPFLAYEPRAMRLAGDWASHAADIRRSRLRENNAYWFIDSRSDLDAKWPQIVAAEPDMIKVFLLDAREHPPVMPDSGLPHGHGLLPSLVPEIVRRAHAVGLRVAAHIETAADFEIAVDAGVDLIAHLPGYDMGTDADGRARLDASPALFEISDAAAFKAGRRAVAVTPTILWTYTGGGPDSAAALVVRQALVRRNIERLQARGVRFVVGSDWFGQTAWHEISAMRTLGVWHDDALLRMWAVETPQAIFPRRLIGKLESGYEASFLVLGDNPLNRFDAVRDIRLRVKQGCVLPAPGDTH